MSRRLLRLGACGAGVAIYPLGLLSHIGSTLPSHVALFFLAFVPYLGAVAIAVRAEGAAARREPRGSEAEAPGALRRPHDDSAAVVAMVLAVAIALRLAMLATNPSLSDDLYRYVWDGKVILHGLNPYAWPPSASELASLQGPLWQPINAKELVTPYPPLAQALFATTYAIAGESVKAQQVAAVVGESLAILALLLVLRGLSLAPERLVIYAWSPLALMQVAHSAHNEGRLIAPLLLAIAADRSRKPALAVVLLAAGVLVKFFVGVAVAAVGSRWHVRHYALFVTVIALAFAPFAVGANPLRGVLFEASDARFNDSLYLAVERASALLFGPRPTVVSALVGGLLLLAIALGWWMARRGSPVEGIAFGMISAFLLLSPVVEPWYLLWVLPFVAIRLRPGRPWAWTPAAGWLLLSGSVVLTELTYSSPWPTAWPIIRTIEYGPLFLLIAWAAVAEFRARRDAKWGSVASGINRT